MQFMRFISGWDKIFKVLIGSLVHMLGVLGLMAFIFFVFGLSIVQSLASSMLVHNDPAVQEEVCSIFGSVGDGMFTLFRSVLNGDDWNNYYQILKVSPYASAVFIFFVFFVQVALFNLV